MRDLVWNLFMGRERGYSQNVGVLIVLVVPVMKDHLFGETTKFCGHFIQVSLYHNHNKIKQTQTMHTGYVVVCIKSLLLVKIILLELWYFCFCRLFTSCERCRCWAAWRQLSTMTSVICMSKHSSWSSTVDWNNPTWQLMLSWRQKNGWTSDRSYVRDMAIYGIWWLEPSWRLSAHRYVITRACFLTYWWAGVSKYVQSLKILKTWIFFQTYAWRETLCFLGLDLN